jgi:nanoRNase/pAp phosphatase (c-di-AMP/oligoRNAs hydrolase)
MASRLLLGCGSFGRAFARRLRERGEPLLVLSDDESRVRLLREENVRAETVDIDDAEAVRARAGAVDTVIVATDGPVRNRELVSVAREAYPEAFCLAYAGRQPTGSQRGALEAAADSVVCRGTATLQALGDSITEQGYRARRLQRVLRRLEEPLAIVTHDNPDPDAIASAFALRRIAENVGIDAEVCYYGNISHQENRAFVNLLDFELRNLSREADLSEFGSFALVDHSRPGVNDGLGPETEVAIVVDHHPPRAPVEARFVDLRSNVGATSTLLTGYLRQLNLEPEETIATALLFGIRVDTKEFSREVSREDYEAAAYLLSYADQATLERIEEPSMTSDTLETIGAAITNRELRGEVLVSCVGDLSDRDAIAQAADRLLDLEGVTTTFVFGYGDDTVYASARARGTDVDLGETLREAFAQVGSAGGHADMAGAQLPVGMIVDEGDEDPGRVIREVVTERFFEALSPGLNRAAVATYADGQFLGTAEGFVDGTEGESGNGDGDGGGDGGGNGNEGSGEVESGDRGGDGGGTPPGPSDGEAH